MIRRGVPFLAMFLCGILPVCARADWPLPQRHRTMLSVSAPGEQVVEMRLDLMRLAQQAQATEPIAPASLQIVSLDGSSAGESRAVRFQFDLDPPAGDTPARTGTLCWLASQPMGEGARRFMLYFDSAAPGSQTSTTPLVTLEDDVEHQGQRSYRIRTPAATYVYHKQGAGFASLFDREGNDWLSYRPTGGSAGNYRGIPNLVHPEGHFHPGGTTCRSRVLAQGPLCVRLLSESLDGNWACRWDIYPNFARLAVLKAPREHWFLYEGTPGGKLDEADDYYVLSTGQRFSARQRWDEDIPGPEWLYFGDPQLNRVLCLAHHGDDEHIDAYYPMQGNMTVFGFGRKGLQKFLRNTPSQFSIALLEQTEHAAVRSFVDGLITPPRVSLGDVERKP